MFRLLQVGLIGLATSQKDVNAVDAVDNVKSKMEKYDRNTVLQIRFSQGNKYIANVSGRNFQNLFKKSYSAL